MKSIIVGALVFLLALGGGSFLGISKAKTAAAEQAAAEAAAAESEGADAQEASAQDPDEAAPAAGDSAAEGVPGEEGPGPEGGDPSATGAAQFAAAGLSGEEDGAEEETPAVPASELGGTDPAGDLNPEGIRRMARIFTAMKPKDAAAVLERMTDVEVQGVMLQMGDRAAAGILSVFDPERAAVLSQIVLGRRGAP